MSIDQFSQLDNDNLRAALLKHGIDAGPVNDMTRQVYLNKLARLVGESSDAGSQAGDSDGKSRSQSKAKAKATNASVGADVARASPQKNSAPSRSAATEESPAKQRKAADPQSGTKPSDDQVAGGHEVKWSQTPAKQSLLSETERQELRNRLSMSVKPRRPIDSTESESFTQLRGAGTRPPWKQDQNERAAARRSRGALFCGLTTLQVVLVLLLFVLTCAGIAYFYVARADLRRLQ